MHHKAIEVLSWNDIQSGQQFEQLNISYGPKMKLYRYFGHLIDSIAIKIPKAYEKTRKANMHQLCDCTERKRVKIVNI